MFKMRKIIITLIIFTFCGCGLVPAYRRSQPDFQKAANMLLSGGSKNMVRSDWGEPDKKEILEDGVEAWTYNNRQDGRTFIFYFDKKGRLIRAKI